MDPLNRFATKNTFLAARAEWLVGFAVAVTLAVLHIGEIRWAVFIGLFVVIDVVGYLPGAIAYRRSATGDISRGFYVAYNVMHSLVTASVIAGLWALFVRPEWALLALPIHLLGDRGLFGNVIKAFGVSFEPERHPLFARFEADYAAETARTRAAKGSGDVVQHAGV